MLRKSEWSSGGSTLSRASIVAAMVCAAATAVPGLADTAVADAAVADAAAARHGCSRAIRVAASPFGRLMTISMDGVVGGWDATLLAEVGRTAGCEIIYRVVSRARALELFKNGEIDIFPAATRTESRDTYGTFVQVLSAQAVLIVVSERWAKIHSTADMVASSLRLDVVRGYEYGAAYDALLLNPTMRPRVFKQVDNATIARRLAHGETDAVLMSPAVFSEAALGAGIADKVRLVHIDDLPMLESGEYVVDRALSAEDAALLKQAIAKTVARHIYDDLILADPGPAWMTEALLPNVAARH